MSDGDSESELPEEFTLEQGVQQDEEINQIQKENKARVIREGKERRRALAQRKYSRLSNGDETVQDTTKTGREEELPSVGEFLPDDIVKQLADRENKVFSSDSEDDKAVVELRPKKRRPRIFGSEIVFPKDIPHSHCSKESLNFLKKKKMEISRSTLVLNNSHQALRFISSSGLLRKA